jgi:hypothetical protein
VAERLEDLPMQIKNITRLALIALLIAWSFDQLFWQKPAGISFLIFVLLCLGGGLLLTWLEARRPASTSLLLLVPILFFAAATVFRLEPFTLLVSSALALGAMILLTLTWLGGGWWSYNVSDLLVNGLRWLGYTLIGPIQAVSARRSSNAGESAADGSSASVPTLAPTPAPARTALSILIGLLLALPVAGLLAGLLAAADPIFAQSLQRVLEIFKIKNLAEYIFRMTYILIFAYALAGVLLYALLKSRDERITGADQPWLRPFIGWIEASTLLIVVDLLFAVFVVIQFTYFFGGHANITLEGYTYAEYARRGFGELVLVATLSLLLFLGLSFVTRRDPGWSRRLFSALGIGLVILVLIMLVSAFQRLRLYEAAYGFSSLRTYTHVFMIWLGVLLLATVALESFGRLQYFTLAALLTCFGFGASLVLLNVDGFIVRQNVALAAAGWELDTGYLVNLSEDAEPGLFAAYHDHSLPAPLHEQLGGILACRAALAGFIAAPNDPTGSTAPNQPLPWTSFHLSRARAADLLQANASALQAYAPRLEDGLWVVTVASEDMPCARGHNYTD